MRSRFPSFVAALVLGLGSPVLAQNEADSTQPAPTSAKKSESSTFHTPTVDEVKETGKKLKTAAEDEVSAIARSIDQDATAKTVSAGILQPIYQLAEALAFSAFHWLAFALMSAGVVSYALQLVLAKLVVLARLGFSLKEIISDAIGLAISVIGLVLTTQAAAENSTFTQSPAAVISATAAGALAGIILYRWGQTQELEAVAGRSRPIAAPKKP